VSFPQRFVRHNEADSGWLRALPDLIETLAERWSLTVCSPFAGIEINFVAPVVRADGARCVLKISRHIRETRNEIAALRLWDGSGAARLLAAAAERGALLIEGLEPGTTLVEVAESNDDQATSIAAGVLRQLWRPVTDEGEGLRRLDDWCAAYDRNRAALVRGANGFPAAIFQRADALRRDLLASTATQSVLHGDMHHLNVLRAQRTDWLAIDPKGLVGDCAFDVCQFLRNPHAVPTRVNRRRLDVLCAELGLDRQRTRDWCFVHAVLDACWDFEGGNPWQRAVAYAEETLSF
jgi:streptomycin 6-kinase